MNADSRGIFTEKDSDEIYIAHSITFPVCLVIPERWKSSFQPSNYGPVF